MTGGGGDNTMRSNENALYCMGRSNLEFNQQKNDFKMVGTAQCAALS